IFSHLTDDVMFEGQSDGGWVTVAPTPIPPQRSVQNLIYDGWAQRVLALGPSPTAVPLIESYATDRVWEWNGTRWRETATSLAEAPFFSAHRAQDPGTRVGQRWVF